jgi:plasmid stabilization system protein ParE
VTPPIVLSEAAREDIQEARRWYREWSGVLARDFVRSVRAAIEGIARSPEMHPVVHRGARRALLRRYPYMLLYVVRTDAIVVVGCWHTHRDPEHWRERLG